MKPLILDNNDYFLRYGGKEHVSVLKLKPVNSGKPHSPHVKEKDWEFVETVGIGNQYKHQSLDIFGQVIQGDDLKKLALDLLQSRLLINREGYCYLESEIVPSSSSSSTLSFSHIEYYRLNDLFGWVAYKVKPKITMMWNHREIEGGKIIISIKGDIVDVNNKNTSTIPSKTNVAKPNDGKDDKDSNDDSKVKDSYETRLKDLLVQMDVLQRKLNSLLDSTKTNNNTSQPSSSSSSSSISPTVLPTPLPLPGHYTFKTEDIDKVLRFGGRSRLTSPDQFIIKIKSYKDLLQSLDDTQTREFETPTFSFDNKKWLMSIFFKGDKDANADDHISLYLKRWVDKNQSSLPPPVTVLVRFFIYNYETKEYLTIQDVKEQVYSDQLDRKGGISRAIKITDFEEPTNGFLRGDKCRFGVEMKVLENRPSISHFLVVPKLNNQWGYLTFPSSSYRKKLDSISTNNFRVDDYTWKVQIYPNGRGSWQNKSFSVFLVLEETTSTADGKHVYAEFELILKDKNNGPDISKKGVAWFTKLDNIQGFEDFISIAEFNKTDKYTKNDSLIIHVHIKKLYKQV